MDICSTQSLILEFGEVLIIAVIDALWYRVSSQASGGADDWTIFKLPNGASYISSPTLYNSLPVKWVKTMFEEEPEEAGVIHIISTSRTHTHHAHIADLACRATCRAEFELLGHVQGVLTLAVDGLTATLVELWGNSLQQCALRWMIPIG